MCLFLFYFQSFDIIVSPMVSLCPLVLIPVIFNRTETTKQIYLHMYTSLLQHMQNACSRIEKLRERLLVDILDVCRLQELPKVAI